MTDDGDGERSSRPATARWNGLRRVGRAVVGDRVGLCLFLATLLFVGTYWRVGPFITDNYTLYNALAAVADGHLWVDSTPVAGTFDTPGMHIVDGRAYARNYGAVVLAVPVLWVVRGIGTVANLHVALVAVWHLLALALVVQVARLRNWTEWVVVGASVLAVGSFVTNLVLTRTLPETAPLLVSLQAVTAIAAALAAVLTYRLVARHHATGLALAGGIAVTLATPVGFWAPVPKRHALTALVVVAVLYAFDRSRTTEAGAVTVPGLGPVPAFRAGAYALVGLYAWVHAAEALFLLIPLVLVDLPTAPSNGLRSLATVAVGFGLALVPLVLTNVLISGDPIAPPRTLPDFDPGQLAPGGGDGGQTTGSPSPSGGSGSPSSAGQGRDGTADDGGGGRGVLWVARMLVAHYRAGISDLLTDGSGLVETLVVTDDLTALRGSVQFRAANLAVLESAPLLAGLLALPVAALVALRTRGRAALASARSTDLLALLLAASLLLLYLPRLPLRVQVTARYLLPLFPLAIYGVARLGVVQRVLGSAGRLAGWSFAVGVLLGAPVVVAVAVTRPLTAGEALQFQGQGNLLLAAGLGLALGAAVLDERVESAAAVALGLAAAGGTLVVLLSGLVYFSMVGPFVLPVVDAVADAIVLG